jgi:hypothetical protein
MTNPLPSSPQLVSDRPALIGPDRKKERIIAAAVEVGGLSPKSNCRLASFRRVRDRRSGGSPRPAVIRPVPSQTGYRTWLASIAARPTRGRPVWEHQDGRAHRRGSCRIGRARRGGVVLPLLVIPLTIPLLIFGSAGLGALAMGFSPSRVSCCSGDALGGRAGFPSGRRTQRSRISRLDRLRKDKTPDVVLASGQCIPPL